ncbi:hypothetical protein [Methanohalophilus mahii]|uniref:Peptidase S54 rhomboid domain-containing protein n=1 Tax=Methanohalophilus mahii (strain ATCC 35705 / DSM 5219 / SLP) TaxID=547558 RepID=D5EAZ0_METMS|nr:hypothetical protein [Methanohalophilus mahii]ADE36341.1 hypothetical protein Mmah_0818 [Methanohalophilus mahii DSM 5219]
MNTVGRNFSAVKKDTYKPLLDNIMHDPVDFFVFLLFVPWLNIVIYFLLQSDPSLATYFVLDSNDPSKLPMFLSNYSHVDLSHLLSNMRSYLLVTPLIIALNFERIKFRIHMLFFFLFLPVLFSILTLKGVPSAGTVNGMSGIVAAMFGYLLYSTFAYIAGKWDTGNPIHLLFAVLCTNLVIISLTYGRMWLVVLCSFIVFANIIRGQEVLHQIVSRAEFILRRWDRENLDLMHRPWGRIKQERIIEIATAVSIIIFLPATSAFLFLGNIISLDGLRTNVLVHYVGYVSGALLPFITGSLEK